MRRLIVGVVVALIVPLLPAALTLAAGPSPRIAPLGMSDFNGDGYADLAVGVPFEDIGALRDAGGVNVLYGSAGGLQAADPADQFWSQDSPGVEGAAEAQDNFGWALAAGDFNGDGFSDLAVGAAGEGVGAAEAAGAVNVLYGSAGGLQATSPKDQLWHQNRPSVGGRAEAFDSFGWTVAAGDFNDDGFSDLAVGVAFESIGAAAEAGAANVLYGSARGLQATSPNDQVWHQDSPSVRGAAESGDHFGWSVAAGDFNGAGGPDLAIGVPDEAVGTADAAGAVNVLHGSANGLRASNPDDQLWHQNSRGVNGTAEPFDFFGDFVTTSNFNGDGFADLAISVEGEDLGDIMEAGAMSVLYGSSGGLQVSSPPDQQWHQDTPEVEDSAEAGDFFGFYPSAGDLNGDGYGDLAVAAPHEDVGSIGNAGAVNVLYGSATGLQTTAPADQLWHQDSPDVDDAAENSDMFGSASVSADFNGDGFADLAVGVPAEDVGAATIVRDAGAANVLYGSVNGLQTTAPPDQFWHQDSPEVEGGAETGDLFGWGFAAGAIGSLGDRIRGAR
ncbi:MAG: hypothetical protein ACRDGU_04210 [Actinomycetota bacterium]